MLEMTDLITASRAYEANATAFDALKNMALKAMEIGK
jgi:flagellar basal-body rod protein FlgC